MQRVYKCPLGNECEKAVDGVLEVCSWYVCMKGTDQTEEIVDDCKCSMAWMPILQVAVAGTNRGQTGALESFRNEMVRGQEEFNQLVGLGLDQKLK